MVTVVKIYAPPPARRCRVRSSRSGGQQIQSVSSSATTTPSSRPPSTRRPPHALPDVLDRRGGPAPPDHPPEHAPHQRGRGGTHQQRGRQGTRLHSVALQGAQPAGGSYTPRHRAGQSLALPVDSRQPIADRGRLGARDRGHADHARAAGRYLDDPHRRTSALLQAPQGADLPRTSSGDPARPALSCMRRPARPADPWSRVTAPAPARSGRCSAWDRGPAAGVGVLSPDEAARTARVRLRRRPGEGSTWTGRHLSLPVPTCH